MNLTYGELLKTVGVLIKKHGFPIEEIEDADNEDDHLHNYKVVFILEVERIINKTTLEQISGKDCKSGEYKIDTETKLSNQSIFSIYSNVHEIEKQDLLSELIYEFLNEKEDDILESFFEAYDKDGNEEIIAFIERENLLKKTPKKSIIYKMIQLIINGDDIFKAIKKLLIENGINPDDKGFLLENTYMPIEIDQFLLEFNGLLLSKLGAINSSLMGNKVPVTLN